MALYLLTRDNFTYDEHGSVLIRATNEDDARRIASEAGLTAPEGEWTNPKTACEIIHAEGDSGVIIEVFHAG